MTRFARTACLAASLALPLVANAQVTRPLDLTATASYYDTFGGDSYVTTFQQGNFIQQSFAAVGLPTVSALRLDLNYFAALANPMTFAYDVTLNGAAIGSFSFLAPGVGAGIPTYGSTTGLLSFAPVGGIGAGSLYILSLVQTSTTVPAGGGAVGLDRDGQNASQVTFNPAVSAVPEPASLLLLGTGLVGVAVGVRRRRATA